MKTFLIFALVSSSVGAFEYHENPNALFSTKKNFTNMSNITWEQADSVQKRCNQESKNRGLGGFSYSVEACSFWGKRLGFDVCHIITEKKTSMATLGHEIRHCFQGDFHGSPK
jgi:hypothetical protein